MDRLRAEHITKSFDGTTIIQDVSLTLHEDELICLLGVSGVGKSTFLTSSPGLSCRTAAGFCWARRILQAKRAALATCSKRICSCRTSGLWIILPFRLCSKGCRANRRGSRSAPALQNSVWKGRSANIPASSRAACGSARRFTAPISLTAKWPCWTSPSARWTQLQNRSFIYGIWR